MPADTRQRNMLSQAQTIALADWLRRDPDHTRTTPVPRLATEARAALDATITPANVAAMRRTLGLHAAPDDMEALRQAITDLCAIGAVIATEVASLHVGTESEGVLVQEATRLDLIRERLQPSHQAPPAQPTLTL